MLLLLLMSRERALWIEQVSLERENRSSVDVVAFR